MTRAVVVGGGLAGLAVAVELAQRGADVTVVEHRYPGAGNSGRNVGRIRRMQLTPELTALACAACDKWDRVHRVIDRRNPLVLPVPYVLALYSDDERESLRALEPMWHAHDARAKVVDPARALKKVPILKGGEPLTGAVISDSAVVHHDAAVYGYYLTAREAGVRFELGVGAEALEIKGGQVGGVVTTKGATLACDVVVNAAGGLAGAISARFGVPIPIRPLRREVLVTVPSRPFMTPAVTFYRPQEGWFNQTLRGELVAGVVDPDEPDGMSELSSLAFLVRTTRMLMQKAPRLGALRVIRQWAGVYEITPDRGPLVGAHAAVPGLYSLSGWSGRGILLSPLCAELLASEIMGAPRSALLAPFGADRFVGHDVSLTPTSTDYYGTYKRS